MAQYIDKDALVAEIERRIEEITQTISLGNKKIQKSGGNRKAELVRFLSFINTLEVKETNIWHLQEKEDIYDAVNDWSIQTFVCVMKDGTIQKFIGNMDEDYEGQINVHIDGVNDGYDDVDDIVKWTIIKDM